MSIESHLPTQELVLQVVKERLEPDWLRDLRLGALQHYQQAPDPLFEKGDLGSGLIAPLPPKEADPAPPHLYDLDKLFGRRDAKNRLVYTNDRIAEHRLQALIAKKGVMFTSLSMAVRLFPRLVQPHLGRVIPMETNKWVAMQTALWNTGVFVYVPRRVRVLLPLHVWWHRTLGGGQFHPRLLVVAEENSEVTLITGETSEVEEDAFSVLVAEVVAKQGAQVRMISLQEQGERMTRLCFARAEVGRDARVEWLHAEGGTGHSVVDLTAQLQGDGAAAGLKAVTLGHRRQRLDLTMTAHHIGQQTQSVIEGQGILSSYAKTEMRTVSKVEPGAVHADAIQNGRFILLDETAQAQVVPTLLMEEEEAVGDHELSIGDLSPDQLFYLMARGLTEKQAKTVLLRGFLAPLVKTLPINGVKKLVDGWLERKIRI